MNGRKFQLVVVQPSTARQVVERFHYSHAWPTGNFLSFGAFMNGRFSGVITFGHPANQNGWKSIPGAERPRDVAELTRLWMADWAPPFMESRTIAAALRVLRRDSICKVALSYADPAQGHTGTVYQASNWICLGQMPPTEVLEFSDGSTMHKRAAFDRFGTDNPNKLRSVDPGICNKRMPGKYKYLYPVLKRLRSRLESLSKPFPRQPVEGTSSPEVEGGADPTLALHPSNALDG